MFINKNILISCNDVGSANLIYFWKKKFNKNNFFFYNEGPAKKIFKNKNINLLKIDQLNIDFIITGTSQFSNLEKKIRNLAKLKKKLFVQKFGDCKRISQFNKIQVLY